MSEVPLYMVYGSEVWGLGLRVVSLTWRGVHVLHFGFQGLGCRFSTLTFRSRGWTWGIRPERLGCNVLQLGLQGYLAHKKLPPHCSTTVGP